MASSSRLHFPFRVIVDVAAHAPSVDTCKKKEKKDESILTVVNALSSSGTLCANARG